VCVCVCLCCVLNTTAVLCYASLYFLNLGGLAIALETDVLHLHDFGYDAPAVLDMVRINT
jgi:hypothetical protein